MKRQQVESSMIRSIGYDAASRTLEIEFNSGGIYQYYEVPPEEHQGLMNAPSHGRYFLARIKDAYPYGKVSR